MRPTMSQIQMKDFNASQLLHVIRANGRISRADLAKRVDVTPATVSSLVSALEEIGLVQETGMGISSGGRVPIMFELSDGAGVIGIEISPTHFAVGLFSLTGTCLAHVRQQIKLPISLEAVIDNVIPHVQEVIAQATCRVLGIGVAIHGPVDAAHGLSIFSPAFHARNVEVVSILKPHFSMPIWLDNDVRAMALGERWSHPFDALDDFIYVYLADGIGSAIVLDGKLWRGQHSSSGELGHIYIGPSDVECYCGKFGCLTTFAAGQHLEQLAKKQLGSSATLSDWIQRAEDGDENALRSFAQSGTYIGQSLATMVNLLDPAAVVLGGELTRAQKWLYPALHAAFEQHAMLPISRLIDWHEASLGEQQATYGAAAIVMQQVFTQPFQFLRQTIEGEEQ